MESIPPPDPGRLRIFTGSSPRIDRGRLLMPLLLATIMSAALVPVSTLFDVSISRWFLQQNLPGDFVKSIELAEFYSHGIGVLFIILLAFRMAPQRRWCLPRLATLAFGAGAVAELVKAFVLRSRPSNLNLEIASYDAAWRWTFDWSLEHVAAFSSGVRSFPSGHAAIATGLSIGLCLMFPRGRLIFLLFLALAMLQRLACFAHFTSDLMGGLALGLIWTYICLSPHLLGALFDKIEPEGAGFERKRKPVQYKSAA